MTDCTFQQTSRNHLNLDCSLDCSQPLSVPADWTVTAIHYAEIAVAVIVGILLVRSCVRIANQWDRAVILRLGKFSRVAGPGIFLKIPFIEKIWDWTSLQVEVTQIKAEKTMTKDTVPINVKTVMFWRVIDPRAAIVEVDDFTNSLELAAQTALREAIGSHDFTELLSDRASVDVALTKAIEAKAKAWGLEVQSIEIQDIQIPDDLQAAMSREAQAEREQHARVILGESEIAIAQKFVDAAKVYDGNQTALQLRAMNIIYETTKERGSTILLPTGMLDALAGFAKAS